MSMARYLLLSKELSSSNIFKLPYALSSSMILVSIDDILTVSGLISRTVITVDKEVSSENNQYWIFY